MKTNLVEKQFHAIGARFKTRVSTTHRRNGRPYAIDIQRDQRGQFFELNLPDGLEQPLDTLVLQTEPRERHLVLLVRHKTKQGPQADRFLCGFDEREWFVAAVPGSATTVSEAKDALQPALVRESVLRHHVPKRKQHWRKNSAFRRQGEWFFLAEPNLRVDPKMILRHEPIRRGAGKPHLVEEIYRSAGEVVWVCPTHPNGLRVPEYHALLERKPAAKQWRWRLMRRNANVYARGSVRHPDHVTIHLQGWHRVVMNTETQTKAMASMAFLD